MSDECVQLKLLIIGESNVGKTSILQRFIENKFEKSFSTTIGIDFRSKTIQIDGREVELQIWDTAGQERFFSITRSYYRGSDGIFLTFDLTSESSFDSLSKWIGEIRDKVEEKVPIFLLGNKKDLLDESKGEISELKTVSKIREISEQLNVSWYGTSAKSGENIEEIFMDMARAILQGKSTIKKKSKASFNVSKFKISKVFWCFRFK
ncbi:Ras-related protein Rab-8A [Nematocida major]|uniref:Ras-related protein Rab-8A n=1 Tax=Nematocida major TaxID=1912982 RepID=UPI0020073849|nr:Ras-related protein Rab-8A [Nematocida major]KAH9387322.1 Ras-related protein Rab-8A [Nematocida major]